MRDQSRSPRGRDTVGMPIKIDMERVRNYDGNITIFTQGSLKNTDDLPPLYKDLYNYFIHTPQPELRTDEIKDLGNMHCGRFDGSGKYESFAYSKDFINLGIEDELIICWAYLDDYIRYVFKKSLKEAFEMNKQKTLITDPSMYDWWDNPDNWDNLGKNAKYVYIFTRDWYRNWYDLDFETYTKYVEQRKELLPKLILGVSLTSPTGDIDYDKEVFIDYFCSAFKIGRKLLNEIIYKSMHRRIHTLVLHPWKNDPNLREFYKKEGFELEPNNEMVLKIPLLDEKPVINLEQKKISRSSTFRQIPKAVNSSHVFFIVFSLIAFGTGYWVYKKSFKSRRLKLPSKRSKRRRRK